MTMLAHLFVKSLKCSYNIITKPKVIIGLLKNEQSMGWTGGALH